MRMKKQTQDLITEAPRRRSGFALLCPELHVALDGTERNRRIILFASRLWRRASTGAKGSVESVAKYSFQTFRKKLWVARAERHGVAFSRVGPVSDQPTPQ
jgi:hypothetical protein